MIDFTIMDLFMSVSEVHHSARQFRKLSANS
jgi:hypothetical protein